MAVQLSPEVDASLVGRIETLAMQAYPPAVVQMHDVWHLRATPGMPSRRVNSVLVPTDPTAFRNLGDSPGGLGTAIDSALAVSRAFYADRGMPIRYQLAVGYGPVGLEAYLSDKGFVADGRAEVLSTPVAEPIVQADAVGEPCPVSLADSPSAAWLSLYLTIGSAKDADAHAARELLERIGGKPLYASAMLDGQCVGIGLGVCTDEWLGLFSLATLSGYRRRGVCSSIVQALAAEAADTHGVQRVYLQVAQENEAARKLYARLGFRRLYQYHFRTLSNYT